MVERRPGTGESIADKLEAIKGWEWQWNPERHAYVRVRVERSADPTLNPWSWQNRAGRRW